MTIAITACCTASIFRSEQCLSDIEIRRRRNTQHAAAESTRQHSARDVGTVTVTVLEYGPRAGHERLASGRRGKIRVRTGAGIDDRNANALAKDSFLPHAQRIDEKHTGRRAPGAEGF